MSPDQFLEIYPVLFDRVSRYVYFRVHHKPDAEDIIASIFLDIVKQLHRFDSNRGNFEQYAVGIARYQIIDYWKQQRITYSLDEVREAFNTADRLQADTTLDNHLAFEQLMATLSPDVQALFALRYVDGLTYQQIAKLVSKKPATVRKLFSLMHKRLRNQVTL